MFNREAAAKARSDQGITYADLAAATQVPVRQVFRFLSGESEPRLTQAGRMARRLGVPLDSLYVHETDATPHSAGALEEAAR